MLQFNGYKNCLLSNKVILKSQQRFKSERHNVYTEEVNKILMIILMKKKTEHNSNWPHIPDHPYRILIVGGSRSGKTNALLNLIKDQPDIDKIYLYAKDPYKAKYQYLINIREKVELKTLQ